MDIKGILNHWIVKNVLLAIAFVLALVTLASVLLNLGTQHNKKIEVPDFTNLTWSEARKAASDAGVHIVLADSVYVKRQIGRAHV